MHGEGSHVVVPLQGSGTFAVEAAVATLVPRDGHVLVLDNGAYCKRIGRLATLMGRRTTILGHAEDAPVSPAELEAALRADPPASRTSASIHCETGTGVLNPLQAIADVCARHGKGLIVDAMSSFAALPIDAREVRFDALVAASGKCLEGVPGMGFVFIRKDVLDGCAGNSHSLAMDLHDQHVYMEKTGQWRFTPPTHVVAALAEAMRQFEEEGGQPARLRALRARTATRSSTAWRRSASCPSSRPRSRRRSSSRSTRRPTRRTTSSASTTPCKARGFILYPGKLTQVETFRVGCIGAIGPAEMKEARRGRRRRDEGARHRTRHAGARSLSREPSRQRMTIAS